MNEIDLIIQSGDWIQNKIDQLLKEYKKCRTENGKALIVKELRGLENKLNYESKNLKRLMNNEN